MPTVEVDVEHDNGACGQAGKQISVGLHKGLERGEEEQTKRTEIYF
jgi:hypothetical protein